MRKLLIVEDEIDILETIKYRFEAEGYTVVTAADGQEGLTKVKTESPDLVILDEMMPKLNGYKMCALLKADARFKSLPVIIYTARLVADEDELKKSIAMDAILCKTADFEELLTKVRELLGK